MKAYASRLMKGNATVAAAATAAVFTVFAADVNAAVVNDATVCNTGTLTGCTVSVEGELSETPAFFKVNFVTDDDGLTYDYEFSDDFDSITASDFNFSGLELDEDGEVASGSIVYTRGVSDPGATAFSLKRGQSRALLFGDAITVDGSQFTFNLGTGQQAVSSFVAYDSFDEPVQDRPVPVPATLGLLAVGLAGVGFAARRRK